MIIESEFFEEEIREGFKVSPMMKRAWAAIIEVYDVISSICKKHNIKYMACAGTLLGAIRHKGFIPWDDDMDLCMLRDDYMHFIEVAKVELPAGFVLAGPYASEERLWQAAHVVHSRVIADEEYFSLPQYMNRFHSYPYPRIGIDIFPYDYINLYDDTMRDKMHTYHYAHFLIDNWENYQREGILDDEIRGVEMKFGVSLPRGNNLKCSQLIVQLADAYIMETDKETSEWVENMQYLPNMTDMDSKAYDSWCKSRYKKNWFNNTRLMPFEMIEIPVPENYIDAVIGEFGDDYMTPKKFTADHEYPFYKKQEAELARMFNESGITASVEEFCDNWHKINGCH